jgi:exodeoxyribonuclease-5
MQLTTKQEEGLKITLERYNAGEQYTCIAGYAGTGKSTLVKFIIDAIGLDAEKEVCYCAFTGKAATVLKEKGVSLECEICIL